MEAYVWPEIPPHENPIDCVSNAVHVRTFLAAAWLHLFDLRFGVQWRNELLSESYWSRIDDLPNSAFWSARQLLKSDLIKEIRERAVRQFRRNGYSESLIRRLTRFLCPDDDCLIIGFGRRFAAYKRATLLFRDPERLARLLNDPERPVLVLFAGKAHPHDGPGQELIRAVHDFSRQSPFEGRVLLVEGYDLALARRLIPGVDVWLNTPRYPLEASGTSGMKAGINGVLHLSILDGWWPEAYDGSFGWAITPQTDAGGIEPAENAEARELLDILEQEVVPLYYDRNRQGYPESWIEKSKASMKALLPRYGAERMVMDYVRQAYGPAARQQLRLAADNFAGARELSRWKRRVAECWPHVSLNLHAKPSTTLKYGEHLTLSINVRLAGLSPQDIVAEALFGHDGDEGFQMEEARRFSAHETNASGETLFNLRFIPEISGLQAYKIRIYPFHTLLTHRFETGLMKWI
jgi:starch phosphorylase